MKHGLVSWLLICVCAAAGADPARAQMNPYFTGITNRWTAGFMAKGQKITGLSNTVGGLRFNTHYQLLPHDHLLHFTLYAEFEDLNQASLYRMGVSGFGVSDLTFNSISEFDFEKYNDCFGYVWGLFRQPRWAGMAGANGTRPGPVAPP